MSAPMRMRWLGPAVRGEFIHVDANCLLEAAGWGDDSRCPAPVWTGTLVRILSPDLGTSLPHTISPCHEWACISRSMAELVDAPHLWTD